MTLADLGPILSAAPIIAVHGRQAFLCKRNARFADKAGRPTLPMFAIDAHKAYGGYVKAMGRRERALSMGEVANCAGENYHTCRLWITEGLIRPSVKAGKGAGRGRESEFSMVDGYLAGLLGVLRRNGCGKVVLKKVSDFFYEDLPKIESPRGGKKPRRRREGVRT